MYGGRQSSLQRARETASQPASQRKKERERWIHTITHDCDDRCLSLPCGLISDLSEARTKMIEKTKVDQVMMMIKEKPLAPGAAARRREMGEEKRGGGGRDWEMKSRRLMLFLVRLIKERKMKKGAGVWNVFFFHLWEDEINTSTIHKLGEKNSPETGWRGLLLLSVVPNTHHHHYHPAQPTGGSPV